MAEVKLRTPTRSFEQELPLAERVKAYSQADALSVVTHPSFGGDLGLLRAVRALTSQPILAKDFIRDAVEVDALVDAGADGVLLLLDMLGEDATRKLAAQVRARGATPFVESTFVIPEMVVDGTPVVPMLNSRNLFSLRENRVHRDALARGLRAGRPFVIASSIHHPEEAVLARCMGGTTVVGGALMASGGGTEVQEWITLAKAPGLVKACGAADLQDAQTALAAGADLVGVNLIPASRRCMAPDALARYLEGIRGDAHLRRRTVFLTDLTVPGSVIARVDAALRAIARTEALAAGKATEDVSVTDVFAPLEQCYFAPRLPGARGILAPSVGGELPRVAGILATVLDGSRPGSGESAVYPTAPEGICATLCAGGVGPGNARERMREAQAAGWKVAGLDAASGVEKRLANGRRAGFDADAIAQLRAALRDP